MKVLVTGAAGYIGSVVSGRLLADGHDVLGHDILRFGSVSLSGLLGNPSFKFEKGDLRDEAHVDRVLASYKPNAIVHLAAIVGDPACKAEPDLAKSVNVGGSKKLFDLGIKHHVAKFVFVSTCSNYGLNTSDEALSEDAPLNPQSLYAETKVSVEDYIQKHTGKNPLASIVLRFSTAHGVSPRMRFDLTVNEFAKILSQNETLSVYDADTWRPYCHVNDFGQAISRAISKSHHLGTSTVYNVGANGENYTKRSIVDFLCEVYPDAKISWRGESKDKRNYKVSFKKIALELGFVETVTMRRSVETMISALRMGVYRDLSSGNWRNI